MDPRSMETLIARLPDGDLEALEGLYRDFHPAVLSYSRLLLRNAAEAEDNAQDTFLKVWAKAATYRSGGSPKAWILGIARNGAVDRLRRTGREIPVDDVAEDEPAFAEDRSAARTAEALDLQAALRILEPADRKIVLLRAVAGLTLQETARMAGLPTSTVHWRYRRALKALGARLAEGEGP